MKTFISTTYETSPFLAGKKIKGQTKKIGLAGHIFCLFRAQSTGIITNSKHHRRTRDIVTF